ncbi:outer membrane protein [Rhodanobacter sp. K2T2]|uniref:TolC family outer membrane protein n=1 Tax=Rhodanobacter sp. K2T2 TaxID=2723085 RepID=UPI0015CDFD2F|nr:TolC family outer membrane protein [Rhodanobacter sp. K2T2]NYE28193.1 outer membrane protein [Rhodanobacter sp. K2T2]
MRLKLLPVLLLLTIAPLSGHGEDLMDAYRQAIANDPVLSTADATRLVVAEGVPQARSALLPQLSAGLSFDQSHGGTGGSNIVNGVSLPTSAVGHSRYRDLNGSLSQAIINLPDIATLRAAHSTSDAQEEVYRAALQDLYVRVASAYFNVLIAQDQVDVYKAYEDGFKQEFDQANERLKVGLENSANSTQAQAFYLSIKSERIAAQDTLKDALHGLEQITGQPTGTLKKLREDIPLQAPTPNDAKAWVDAAMQTNPAILSARYTVSADEHKISAARAGHLPTLSANVYRDKFGSWASATPMAGDSRYGPATTTVGLTLTVPIFSGGLTQSQVRQAIHQRDADEGNLETQRRQAARDANNYFNLVVDGIDQVETTRTAVQVAEKSLGSMRAGYSIGTMSLPNVVNAIQILAQAQGQYTVERHQFILNKLSLKQAAGTIDMHDLEDINRLLQ